MSAQIRPKVINSIRKSIRTPKSPSVQPKSPSVPPKSPSVSPSVSPQFRATIDEKIVFWGCVFQNPCKLHNVGQNRSSRHHFAKVHPSHSAVHQFSAFHTIVSQKLTTPAVMSIRLQSCHRIYYLNPNFIA